MAEAGLNDAIDSLILGLPPAKVAVPFFVEVGRELQIDDIALLEATTRGVETPSIKSIRAKHHMLARELVSGKPQVEVSRITGFSQSRISILKNDPAFRDLMTHYQKHEEEFKDNIRSKLQMLAEESIDILAERLEETPEVFTNGQLLEITKATADRVGHGPTSQIKGEVKHVLSSEQIEAIKSHANGKDRVTTQRRSGFEMGAVIDLDPVRHPQEKEGGEGEGASVREADRAAATE